MLLCRKLTLSLAFVSFSCNSSTFLEQVSGQDVRFFKRVLSFLELYLKILSIIIVLMTVNVMSN